MTANPNSLPYDQLFSSVKALCNFNAGAKDLSPLNHAVSLVGNATISGGQLVIPSNGSGYFSLTNKGKNEWGLANGFTLELLITPSPAINTYGGGVSGLFDLSNGTNNAGIAVRYNTDLGSNGGAYANIYNNTYTKFNNLGRLSNQGTSAIESSMVYFSSKQNNAVYLAVQISGSAGVYQLTTMNGGFPLTTDFGYSMVIGSDYTGAIPFYGGKIRALRFTSAERYTTQNVITNMYPPGSYFPAVGPSPNIRAIAVSNHRWGLDR